MTPGWWRKVGLAGSAVVATALLIELGMLVSGSHEPRPVLYPGDRTALRDGWWDPRVGWRLPPFSRIEEVTEDYSVVYRANRQGFRSPSDFALDQGERRIAFLGDSFTFGSGVRYRETFAARVELELEGVRSLNYGIGGFGIDQMWLTLRNYVLPLRADSVVVSFIWSDLGRSLSSYRLGHGWLEKPAFRLQDGRLVPLAAKDRPPVWLEAFRTRSRFVELLRRSGTSLTKRTGMGYLWRLNQALFAKLRDDCRAAGVHLLVVYLPTNRRHPVRFLSSEFERLEIEFLDLMPLLPENAEELYYPVDRHFNAAGHRFVAGAILDGLRRRGWG